MAGELSLNWEMVLGSRGGGQQALVEAFANFCGPSQAASRKPEPRTGGGMCHKPAQLPSPLERGLIKDWGAGRQVWVVTWE